MTALFQPLGDQAQDVPLTVAQLWKWLRRPVRGAIEK